MVATPEEELKAEEELLNENEAEVEPEVEPEESSTVDQAAEDADLADGNSNAVNNGTSNKEAAGENKQAAGPDMEETHISEFDIKEHSDQFFNQINHLRELKTMNDGNIVFASEGERKRISVLMSSVSSCSTKLMNSFYKAKRTMMEHGFFHTSIDLKLPHFAQPGQSTPETAVRSVINYIYNGKLEVSSKSIKNVTVLASYLEIKPILDMVETVAAQLGCDDFNFEELKNIGNQLPQMTVDGLKKFVEAGFGTLSKMKTNTGDKRKQNKIKNKQNNEPNNKKPKVEGAADDTKSRALEEPVPETTESDSTATKTTSEETTQPEIVTTPVTTETTAPDASAEAVADATEETPRLDEAATSSEPTIESGFTSFATPATAAAETTPAAATSPKPAGRGTRGRGRGRGRRGARGRRGRGN